MVGLLSVINTLLSMPHFNSSILRLPLEVKRLRSTVVEMPFNLAFCVNCQMRKGELILGGVLL